MFKRFRQPKQLAAANVLANWIGEDDWRRWESPRNFVAGESHYTPALQALTGPPRAGGYLRPVAVAVIRERNNRYDANAFRIEVEGQHVGYLAREIAAQLAGELDQAGCAAFTVCGVIRGGSKTARNLGVHVWLDRRLTAGPEITIAGDAGIVGHWPPSDDEGR